MGRAEKRVRVSELVRALHQRSGARCEGHRLGLECTVKLTGDVDPLIHHIDGDPGNNKMSNLVLLCSKCHSGVMERLSEKRRKTYVKKAAESPDKSVSTGNRRFILPHRRTQKKGEFWGTVCSPRESVGMVSAEIPFHFPKRVYRTPSFQIRVPPQSIHLTSLLSITLDLSITHFDMHERF